MVGNKTNGQKGNQDPQNNGQFLHQHILGGGTAMLLPWILQIQKVILFFKNNTHG